METVHQLFDYDGMVWTVIGRSPAAGTAAGMDEVMRNFGDIMAWTEGTYDAVPVDHLGSDSDAVAVAPVHSEPTACGLTCRRSSPSRFAMASWYRPTHGL